MTEDQRDALTERLFSSADGTRFRGDLDDRAPYLAAELRQRIRRARQKAKGSKP